MVTLHGRNAIFSPRHVATWMLLAFAAGCTNIIAFLGCARFVTHVTGTLASIALDSALEIVVVLVSFLVGAMVATLLLDVRAIKNKRALYPLPLLLVALLLAAIPVVSALGLLGTFGDSTTDTRDVVLLSGVAFAMGVQNAAVAMSTGLVIRTTHMTGAATDLGIHFTKALFATGELRRSAARHAALRAGKISAFGLGAFVATIIAPRIHYAAFLVPASLVAIATFLSFAHVEDPAAQEAAAE